MARRFPFAALLTALIAGAASAQPADLAQRQQQMRELADQKADAHVRDSIKDAGILAKASGVAAVERLKQLKVGIDTMVISKSKRDELFKVIDLAIVSIQNPTAPTVDSAFGGVKADKAAAEQAMKREASDIASGIAAVTRLNEEGRTREAEIKAAELAQRYPNNPAAFVLVEKGTISERIAESNALAKMQNERILYTFNDVMRSSLPVKGDIEFPKDWNERMKNRPKGDKLSPELEAIMKSLDTPIPTQLQSMPFEEAVQELSTQINQPIYLDKKSIEEVPGFDMKKAVTPLAVPKGTPLSARTVLRALLQSQGLTFVVKDNIIQVVTIEKAQGMLSTKAYYIGDIIQAVGPFGGAVKWGTYLDYQQTESNVKMIVEAIRGYDPMAWRERSNGPASVTFHYPSMSIIVKAPAEVHATLGSKLGTGK